MLKLRIIYVIYGILCRNFKALIYARKLIIVMTKYSISFYKIDTNKNTPDPIVKYNNK